MNNQKLFNDFAKNRNAFCPSILTISFVQNAHLISRRLILLKNVLLDHFRKAYRLGCSDFYTFKTRLIQ